MSGAETLRRAAALMRERAEAATPGPWVDEYSSPTGPVVIDPESSNARDHIASCPHYRARLDAEHIASWNPAVALAVADLLEIVATQWSDERCDAPVGPDEPCGVCAVCDRYWLQERTLAVARAFLQGECDV